MKIYLIFSKFQFKFLKLTAGSNSRRPQSNNSSRLPQRSENRAAFQERNRRHFNVDERKTCDRCRDEHLRLWRVYWFGRRSKWFDSQKCHEKCKVESDGKSWMPCASDWRSERPNWIGIQAICLMTLMTFRWKLMLKDVKKKMKKVTRWNCTHSLNWKTGLNKIKKRVKTKTNSFFYSLSYVFSYNFN